MPGVNLMTLEMNVETHDMIIKRTKQILLQAFVIAITFSISVSEGFCLGDSASINAEFEVVKTSSKTNFDMRVNLDVAIHNSSEEKLNGTKVICKQDIDSLMVTDKNNNRLLYMVKAAPQKRLVWEYPKSENGVRRVKISFMIRDAAKVTNNKLNVNLDWLGGWDNKVLNSNYSIIFPKGFSEQNILKVFPKKYQVQKLDDRLKISHNLINSSLKGINVVLKAPADFKSSLKKKASKQKKSKKISSKPGNSGKNNKTVLKDIRFASHIDKFDRIVFELTRNVNYETSYNKTKKELEIKWKEPITVNKGLLTQQKINSRFIENYSWRKIRNKDLVSVIKFNKDNISVKDGTLKSPPRIYLDFTAAVVKKQKPEKVVEVKKTRKIKEKKPKSLEVTRIIKSRIPQDKKKKPVTDVLPEKYIKMNLDFPDNVPIEEKVMYKNANKFYDSNDFAQALKAYNEVLLKFPDSILKEHIFYRIADAIYNLAEKKQGKTYNDAAKSYQYFALVNAKERTI